MADSELGGEDDMVRVRCGVEESYLVMTILDVLWSFEV